MQKPLLQDRFPAETADFTIWGVSDPEAPEDHSVIFVKNSISETCSEVKGSIFITREETALSLDASSVQLKSSIPKNLYGELLLRMERMMPGEDLFMKNGSYVSADAKLGKNVSIAPFCVIGRDVVIGDNCEIGAGTIIKDHVRIGNDVQIKEHCMIGVEDADIYRPESGAGGLCPIWQEPSLRMAPVAGRGCSGSWRYKTDRSWKRFHDRTGRRCGT